MQAAAERAETLARAEASKKALETSSKALEATLANATASNNALLAERAEGDVQHAAAVREREERFNVDVREVSQRDLVRGGINYGIVNLIRVYPIYLGYRVFRGYPI